MKNIFYVGISKRVKIIHKIICYIRGIVAFAHGLAQVNSIKET